MCGGDLGAVGVIVTAAAVDVPELLQRYRARRPDVRVALRSGRSDEMAAAIRDGALDIAFLGLPEGERPSGVETVVLDHDEHVFNPSPATRAMLDVLGVRRQA